MSELKVYEKMANGLKYDIRAMEEESKTLDMVKHPYFEGTLMLAKAELANCEMQITRLGGGNG